MCGRERIACFSFRKSHMSLRQLNGVDMKTGAFLFKLAKFSE